MFPYVRGSRVALTNHVGVIERLYGITLGVTGKKPPRSPRSPRSPRNEAASCRGFSIAAAHQTFHPIKPSGVQRWETKAQQSTVAAAATDSFVSEDKCAAYHEVPYAEARDTSEIPGPTAYPIIGSILSIAPFGDLDVKRRIDMAKTLCERYGPICQMKLPIFRGASVFIFDPPDFEKVFRADGEYPMRVPSSNRIPIVNYRRKAGMSVGLIASNSEEWWDLRKAINKPMTRARAAHDYLHLQDPVANDLVSRIRATRDPVSDEVRDDFINELYKYALESVLAVCFGKRILLLQDDLKAGDKSQTFVDAVQTIFGCLNELIFSVPLWQAGIKSSTYRRFERANEDLGDFIAEKIEEATKEGLAEDKRTFFGNLMQTEGLSDKHRVVVITDMLLAGVDTTGSTLGFLLYNLAKHPEIQQRLYEEFCENFPDRGVPIVPNKFEFMPFLKAVQKENFRRFPTFPMILRTTPVDLVLKGYKIPKGTTIFMEWGGAANHDHTFPEPEEFIPHRWLRGTHVGRHKQKTDAQDSGIHSHTVLPFGHGRRMCVGRRFADQELHLALTRILQHFVLEYHHEDIGIESRLISLPDKPLKIKFVDRN